MTLDFNATNDRIISLIVVKNNDETNRYSLIDEERNTWIELSLSNQSLSIISKSSDIIEDDESIESKLDILFFEIIEAEKSGTDNFGDIEETELNPYDPDKIKVRSDKINITLLSNMINDHDIELSPDFQRNLVWNHFQKSRLIESILLRIPLPMFYFSEDYDGKLTVVDGLQRITTIKEFMDNKFPLKNLQYLGVTCNDRFYKDDGKKKGLDTKYSRWFNLTSISANIIDPSSPYKVKYDIFRRINTGGRPLNNQEIRNCLTGKGLRSALKEMTSLKEFKSATDKSIKSTRMEDQEIALRFLYFYSLYEEHENVDDYNGYMEATLDEYTEKNIKASKSSFDKYILLFRNAMINSEYLIGKKYAFRKIKIKDIQPNSYKQLINKALFVCTSVLLAKYDPVNIKNLNDKDSLTDIIARRIENNKELFYYLSYGTNGKANLLYTFKELQEIIEHNITY